MFGLFYGNAFIAALNQFVIASIACIWYFKRDSPNGMGGPVRTSYWRAFRYHLGSLAFGSLILAIIQFIIFVLEYVKQKIESATGTKSGFYQVIIRCVQCCLLCFERFIEFLNRHAYIQIALNGKSFCVAAFEGFGLILSNFGRYSALKLVGGIFILLGKLFISSATAITGYLIITKVESISNELYSPILPAVVMFIFGWITASIFMSIYGVAGDALLHCFATDENCNNGAKYAPDDLSSFVKDEK